MAQYMALTTLASCEDLHHLVDTGFLRCFQSRRWPSHANRRVLATMDPWESVSKMGMQSATMMVHAS